MNRQDRALAIVFVLEEALQLERADALLEIRRFAKNVPLGAGVLFLGSDLGQDGEIVVSRPHRFEFVDPGLFGFQLAERRLRFARSIPKAGFRRFALQLGDAGAAGIRVKETPEGR
jgi:hypothetical protein